MSCDAELKPNGVIKGIIIIGYILGGLLGLSIVLLSGNLGLNFVTTIIAFLVTVAIVALPLDLIGWKKGRYELAKKSSSS